MIEILKIASPYILAIFGAIISLILYLTRTLIKQELSKLREVQAMIKGAVADHAHDDKEKHKSLGEMSNKNTESIFHLQAEIKVIHSKLDSLEEKLGLLIDLIKGQK